jgi:hypothetical protein
MWRNNMYEPTIGYAMFIMGLLGAFAMYDRTSPERHLCAALGFMTGVGLVSIVATLLAITHRVATW